MSLSRLAAAFNTARVSLVRRADALWGYDVFIAHRRADAAAYAKALHQQLTTEKLSAFIDKEVYGPGDSLLVATRRHVAKSTLFVLLGSPELLSRREPVDWVERELDTYLTSHPSDPKVVLVDFGHTVTDALAKPPTALEKRNPILLQVDPFLRLSESLVALLQPPSQSVVDAIKRNLEGRRRDRSRLRFFEGMAAGLAALLVAALAFAAIAIFKGIQAENGRRTVLSQLLASQSAGLLTDQPDLALLLSLESNRISNTVEARSSLINALTAQPTLVRYLRGHNAQVNSVVIGRDNTIAISGDDDGIIRFWQLPSGDAVGTIDQGSSVRGLAVSPDDALLASGGNDHAVHLWNLNTRLPNGEPLRGHDGFVSSVAFAPNGLLASADSNGKVIFWNVLTGERAGDPLDSGLLSVFKIAFSPDRYWLAVAGQLGAKLLDLRTQTWSALGGDNEPVMDIVFAPDENSVLARADAHGGLVLRDVGREGAELVAPMTSGRPSATSRGTATTATPPLVQAIVFGRHSSLLLSSALDGFIHVQDRGTLVEAQPPWRASAGVSELAASSDGETVISSNWDGSLVLWNLKGKSVLSTSLPSSGQAAVSAIAFDPLEQNLISSSVDGSLVLWDLSHPKRDPRRVRKAGGSPILSVALSADGEWFAAVDGKKRIVAGRVDNPEGAFYVPTTREVRSNILFASNHTLLFGTADGIVLWNIERGTQEGFQTLSSRHPVVNVAYSGHAGLIAAADELGSLSLVDATTLHFRIEWKLDRTRRATSLVFGPDGKSVASAGLDGSITLSRLSEPSPLWTVGAEAAHATSIAFSPIGDLLVSGGSDGKIALWDAASGQRIGAPLSAHDGGVDDLVFTRGGLLRSAGEDGEIRLWEMTMTAWKERACGIVAGNLKTADWHRFLGEESPHSTCPPDSRAVAK